MKDEAMPVRRGGTRRLTRAWMAVAIGALALGAIQGRAQERLVSATSGSGPAVSTPEAPTGDPTDPRVGLKAGFKNAGEAARNMELVSNTPKPKGFFDPKAPAGVPMPAERDQRGGAAEQSEEAPARPAGPQRGTRGPGGLAYANSDLAFQGNHLFIGNFTGFNVYDVKDAKSVKLIASIVCPGGQGDVSVYANLLVMSVEETRGRLDCGTQGIGAAISSDRFRGVRIFDITDVRKPKQVAAVQTCRGSHTHSLVTSPQDTANLYIYGSGTSAVRSADELAGCSGKDPKEDPDTSLFSIDVIQVPLNAPEKAQIVNRPRIFADPSTGAISGLWPGGSHGPGTQTSRVTNQCHDITVFPAVGLAAGACSGNGILLDISNPVNPVRLDHVVDKNFAYWHSATFNNDGTKVIFTDEWGGGTRPRCQSTDQPTWGANAIFDIVERKMEFRGYYKLPAPQSAQENCVAHNGSLVPVPGRDIMVQAWYQGGVSVFDFTDSANPVEIAFFDRGPLDPKQLLIGGHWSAYWYNGQIFGAEMARGLDVFRLKASEHLSQNEIDAARLVHVEEFNAQHQPRFVWPPSSVVARAYLDQLTRTNAIAPERLASVNAALQRADKVRSPRDTNGGEAAQQLDTLAGELERDAGAAADRDALRLRSLASTLKGRAASIR